MKLKTGNSILISKFYRLVALQKYHSTKEPYDVVVLDLDMPIMNGFDTCSKIRKSGAKESIRELLGFGGTPKNKRLT